MVPMKEITLDYLEFYSGVGGWTMALEEASERINRKRCFQCVVKLRRVAYFDHSDLCNHVFQYNFDQDRQSKIKLTAIEKLTLNQLQQKYKASIWAMSPPCQPHTRQHSNQHKDLQDARSQSFLHLCSILENMATECLPNLIFLENVVGFEKSDSFHRWRKVLHSRNYALGHFHLTPTQFCIPNDRPRYYGVAILFHSTTMQDTSHQSPFMNWVSSVIQIEPMISENPNIHSDLSSLYPCTMGDIRPISDFLDDILDETVRSHVAIPSKLMKSTASWCWDIVRPCDRRSSCFTHSYGTWARGTGSILYVGSETCDESNNKRHKVDELDTSDINKSILDCIRLVPPEERKFDANWSDALQSESDLRYLTGQEMARLMGFPIESREGQQTAKTFRFPPDVTMKQQWKLVGNSLNVVVAAGIIEVGLSYLLHRNYYCD